MYKLQNKKRENKIIRKLLILSLIFCLSSCNNMKKNIQLEDGTYVASNAYQLVSISSLGGPNFKVKIEDYKITINEEHTGNLNNFNMKDEYITDSQFYICFNGYSKETLEELSKVKKVMKVIMEDEVTEYYPGIYYVINLKGNLFLCKGEYSSRIYALTKEE